MSFALSIPLQLIKVSPAPGWDELWKCMQIWSSAKKKMIHLYIIFSFFENYSSWSPFCAAWAPPPVLLRYKRTLSCSSFSSILTARLKGKMIEKFCFSICGPAYNPRTLSFRHSEPHMKLIFKLCFWSLYLPLKARMMTFLCGKHVIQYEKLAVRGQTAWVQA